MEQRRPEALHEEQNVRSGRGRPKDRRRRQGFSGILCPDSKSRLRVTEFTQEERFDAARKERMGLKRAFVHWSHVQGSTGRSGNVYQFVKFDGWE